MKIKAYFLFPETEDDFIRIGDNPASYIELIDEIVIIKQQLKKHNDFELWYDSENVNLFLEKAEILVNGEYLASCRTQIQQLFGSFSRNVTSTILRKADCIYANWDVSCTVTNAKRVIAEAAEAKHNEGQDKTVLISISSAYATNRDSIHVIKDAVHYTDLPLLIKIPVANNEIEFSEWVTALANPIFSLRNTGRFQTTPYKWKKQIIYREVATGYFWYYDYFHRENKQHFEVFNQAGIHLGEANTSGTLDTSKADGDKRIDNIIQ
jgi:hypothetical protein